MYLIIASTALAAPIIYAIGIEDGPTSALVVALVYSLLYYCALTNDLLVTFTLGIALGCYALVLLLHRDVNKQCSDEFTLSNQVH